MQTTLGTNGRSSGEPAPVVLISPAMAIGSRYYRPVVAAFEEAGWDARALTRRGFEDPSVTAGRGLDWAYQDEIDDIADAVAAARRERPDRPVLLLGHSLGAQLAAGYLLTGGRVDGLITVAGALPYHRHFPYGGLHLVLMGGVIVPTLTAVFGYLPRPAFGGPGARTLMREWATMARSGRPPFPTAPPIATPSLVVSLDDDPLAPRRAVEAFARDLFAPGTVNRWHYADREVPAGASNDHIRWVRSPERVVSAAVDWWAGNQVPPSPAPTAP
ncbi:alpha/beta fold hydrolase [Isoptericola sp. b408]|uniref:alpha/beta fold hydrolase n=1 Tax=Isoptericola sp. b408 TaxID=3064653 RepID=UPI0027138217|nr:alpha/beta fold hydrolase [Isoptericola sp. b408]MDO8149992.1 alpha/beta hydrolase [Isoptericola sp. b408]